ncbi:hypothetical protein NS303_21750 [Pantoea ananatis]|uniref:hypothetical protein n=1 Tax=Pantoea TaxID=53335 RepID=UPI0007985350|nr:hypothetical protein [Pantoea ananatis]KTR45548.1 hypothetical protein NS303_21750 [Pantoea ananatis]KTR54174.1 hypothetical protein NS311_17140 [Pantoea ananatis]KTR62535.1 hypothetical protein RSA47_20990 [Pantoea ananatis]KTR68093.1 hypothetical protein NS296_19950 [Pantoea ananatis]MCW0310154.1 hypothetical protein [Pantoea ananatis]
MSIEYILGIIGVIVAAIMTAFGVGHSKGKSKAEQAATERETQTNIESMKAATQRQNETIKGAADVQETVSRMPGSAVDDELLREWTRKD